MRVISRALYSNFVKFTNEEAGAPQGLPPRSYTWQVTMRIVSQVPGAKVSTSKRRHRHVSKGSALSGARATLTSGLLWTLPHWEGVGSYGTGWRAEPWHPHGLFRSQPWPLPVRMSQARSPVSGCPEEGKLAHAGNDWAVDSGDPRASDCGLLPSPVSASVVGEGKGIATPSPLLWGPCRATFPSPDSPIGSAERNLRRPCFNFNVSELRGLGRLGVQTRF